MKIISYQAGPKWRKRSPRRWLNTNGLRLWLIYPYRAFDASTYRYQTTQKEKMNDGRLGETVFRGNAKAG